MDSVVSATHNSRDCEFHVLYKGKTFCIFWLGINASFRRQQLFYVGCLVFFKGCPWEMALRTLQKNFTLNKPIHKFYLLIQIHNSFLSPSYIDIALLKTDFNNWISTLSTNELCLNLKKCIFSMCITKNMQQEI